MAADPTLVAIMRQMHDALNPPERIALERSLRKIATSDGHVRSDRLTGPVPRHALPIVTAEQVFPDGFDYDDLQAMLEGFGGTYAPTAATFITQTPNSTLTAEQALSTLSTGLVKVTTGTGVLSTATANTDYLPVASPIATGTLTADNLTATGNSTLGNGDGDILLAQGHVKHKSAAPGIAVGAALGTGGSVAATIAGTDQVGNLTLVAGTTSLGTGTAATITFATARPNTSYEVYLWFESANAATNAVVARTPITGITTSTWTISFGGAPTAGQTYRYHFRVMEWSN